MLVVNKKIKLDNGNIILINVSSGYACNTVTISEGYLKNNNVVKSLDLSIWDDMRFNAHTSDDNINSIYFEIDINHPLYFCVKQLLDEDEELIIDDDDTREELKKYLIIKRENNIFKFIFINNKENYFEIDKFSVFIKNICPDLRSKITDDSVKMRIVKFFRDAEKTLLEDYHQITLEEHTEFLKQEQLTFQKVKKI